MASIKNLYAGKYMVAEDLPVEPLTAVILSASVDRQFGRVALKLDCTGRILLLNKTNAKNIAATLGDDTDVWEGAMVVLRREPVTYMGDQVDGIRVVSVVKP